MTNLEAIKRLEWFLMISKVVDSVTLGGDDMECLEMAVEALREKEFKASGKTNADRIRSMTDEQLAYLLHGEYFEGFNKGLDRDFDEMLPYYKDWLKQPYKEDT